MKRTIIWMKCVRKHRETDCSVLSVSPELLGVSVLPVRSAGRSLLHSLVTLLVHASVSLSSHGESTELSVVLLAGADPVDAWVSSDGLVGWIDEDDFVEFEGCILSYPVGVQNTEVSGLASNTGFGGGLVRSGGLELADTHVSWLSVDASLGDWSLTSSSSDTGSEDNESLLSLVTKLACSLWSGWTSASVDGWKLSKLPTSDSEDESNEIGLLLSPQLFEVLVCSHLLKR